jgi:hypothetical protein
MNRLFSTFAALVLLLAMALVPAAHAQTFGSQDVVGTWTFFVKIDGAPPCQCIVLIRLRSDGTLDTPGNDHFTGFGIGEWKKTGFNTVNFAFVQNNFNMDGSAGGEYVIRGTMNLNPTVDQATGTSTFQILDNGGGVMASGTASFTATKLKVQ